MRSIHGAIEITKDRCKGCALCVQYCPCDVLEMSSEFNHRGHHLPRMKNSDACLECHVCEMLCPEFAIIVTLRTRAPVV